MNAPSSRPLYRDRNLQIIFAITLMAVLGVASISPAFPAITRHFAVTPRQIGWLITLFTLPGVLLTPVLGVLADRVSKKIVINLKAAEAEGANFNSQLFRVAKVLKNGR